ncbi:hypothetical protein [Tichowtungia aerotolerans]|uniref:LamG domain-containing protein n=1 Tax=Tichowtungia aerotolerans TaxID=2697043 RepID=A0A6P1M3K9_9BACT|nr:hypothetical protein [Tichowtungia aerotolerans]QHI69429.1 hypothetical protein GT409_08165 [Tichowtungia aerotolerans]
MFHSCFFMQWVLSAVFAAGTAAAQAGVVAYWDFEEGSAGTAVVSAGDSVSGLAAVPAAGDVQYVAGNDSAAAIESGILKAEDPNGILNGLTELNITFDINLAADVTGGTQVCVRNGYSDISFNVYLQAGNAILARLTDVDGNDQTVRAYGSDLSAAVGWQTVSVVWTGSELSISVDGVFQLLNYQEITSVSVPLGRLVDSDADFGIGGMIRTDGTTSQKLNGSLDNIVISNTGAVPVLSTHAGTVASWDFEEGVTGSSIVEALDSASGLTAVPATGSPVYVTGSGGGVAAGAGILKVPDSAKRLIGFSKFEIMFDVDLNQDVTDGTQAFLRNGYSTVPLNIYLQSDNTILVWLTDINGNEQITRAYHSDLSAAAGWQTVSVVWDGRALAISVDGVAQQLNSTPKTFAVVLLDELADPDADFGIGGMIRANGTTSQQLDGSLDNIIIKTPDLVGTLSFFGLDG